MKVDMMSDSKTKLKIEKTEAEWQQILTPEQFYVTRKQGTERPFSHPYHDLKNEGDYDCQCCGAALFKSDAKFDSRTGWPSFFSPVSEDAVIERADNGLFSRRTEILCASCEAHLGHVFPDGPQPTGLRYCMNGASLDFSEDDTSE